MAGHIATAGNVSWCTPNNILDAVRNTFGGWIHLDPCSNEQSVVNARVEFRLPERDGLVEPWDPYVSAYINPPFGTCFMDTTTREALSAKEFKARFPDDPRAQVTSGRWRRSTIADWVTRARDFARAPGKAAILLIPAAVDTAHWQKTIFPEASAICFVKGRIRFLGAVAGAPMACAMVLFGDGGDADRFERAFRPLGTVVRP